MSILVQFNNVSKKFGYKTPIDNVSFSIERGKITTLIGPNGAGKTTIARLMLDLEKPSTGKIFIEKNLKLGYVPQKLNFSTDLPITTDKFVELIAPAANKQEFTRFSNFIDYNKLENKALTKLSGGELQKLLLLATLLNKPDLLILDEPTHSLDIISQREFYNLIESTVANTNLTIFMISHDLFTVMKNSDQVICINGHVCCSGKPKDIDHNQEFLTTLSTLGFYPHRHDHRH